MKIKRTVTITLEVMASDKVSDGVIRAAVSDRVDAVFGDGDPYMGQFNPDDDPGNNKIEYVLASAK
jgi:RPA family protein